MTADTRAQAEHSGAGAVWAEVVGHLGLVAEGW